MRLELEDVYKLMLEQVPWPIWIETIDYKLVFVNKKYEDLYGISLEDVKGCSNEEIFSTEQALIYNQQIKECIEKKDLHVVEGNMKNRIYRCYILPLLTSNQEIIAIAGAMVDITNQKNEQIEIEKQKNILRTIIDAVPEAIFFKDTDSRYIGYNKNFADFYKRHGVSEIIDKTDLEIYPDKETAKAFMESDQKIIQTKEPTYYEQIIDNGNGIKVEENLKIPVLNQQGDVFGIVGLSRDITERKTFEERLKYLSEIDMLTGLYNRYSFEEKLSQLNDEKYLPLGIMMGDVNGLKLVNDTLGHLEGDKLLKGIAMVLEKNCGEKGFVFRWGGDEFVILIPNCNADECEQIENNIMSDCEKSEYKFIQLSIALAHTIKTTLNTSTYDCIKQIEQRVYRHKLLDKKSIKSSILDSLKKSLQEKNMETNEHTERVTLYALALGKTLKLNRSELDELELVAQLHDIGKIGISEDILLKPGRLTAEEFEIMKTHTEKGYRIINASSELDNVAKCVLTHHEKYDGSGYPLGLKEKEIPLMARIINIADSYDVMTSDRVYKKAMTKKQAIDELNRCSGTQFDPKLVKCFIQYLENN